MIRRAWVWLAAAAVAVPAAAYAERVVDYAVDEATWGQWAAEQGLEAAPLPAHGSRHVAVSIAPAADHKVTRVGISCSAWTVQNPMTALLQRYLAAWDRDGAPAAAAGPGVDLTVTVDRAATLSRCVGTGEMKSTCITRVSIDGSTAGRSGAATPFHVERELATKGVGACAGLTRGIALVSRDAAAKLVRDLDKPGATAG